MSLTISDNASATLPSPNGKEKTVKLEKDIEKINPEEKKDK